MKAGVKCINETKGFLESVSFIRLFDNAQQTISMLNVTRPAWAGFKTAEEGRTKIM